MDPAYEVVAYEARHKEEILALQTHLWSADLESNRAYFGWKYEQNPYLPAPAISVALHAGRVVGMRGIFGARWVVGPERTLDIPYTDDFVIAPEHRGVGLASRLIHDACARAGAMGYPYLLSLRASTTNLLASLGAGYRSIGAMKPVGLSVDRQLRMPMLRQKLRGLRFLWRFADAPWLRSPAERNPFHFFDRSARTGGGAGPAVTGSAAPRPEAMAELEQRLPPDRRFRHVRDTGFLGWAFRNPRLRYRFLWWGADPLEGYLVLHAKGAEPPDHARVWISDWQGTTPEVRAGLLDAAVARGRFRQLCTWTATYPEDALEALTRHGFQPVDPEERARGRPAAIIRSLQEAELESEWTIEGRSLVDLGNWKLRLLDQD